uniref:ATP synthase F0 subunit 8 n=1 Tax=Aleurocanthus spiniferus TaxID=593793 RepID=A0A0X8TLH7_ALESP|nr:ATP synthase F0 subunit 8 [Aleurocanthus spiniferus]AHY04217.1 ATP synthase F0 subunit 8 [Aleurocanthus spiniferus]
MSSMLWLCLMFVFSLVGVILACMLFFNYQCDFDGPAPSGGAGQLALKF